MARIAWLNGDYLPLADARISPLDRGFLFADGIYEVTAVLDGRLVDSAAHLARLQRSAGEIGLCLPVTFDELEAIERELIRRNGLDQGTTYLQLTRGTAAERDFHADDDLAPTLFLYTQAKDIIGNPAARTGVAVVTTPDLRWARRDIKSVSLLAQVLAKQVAHDAGAFEAWLVEDGHVTEGSSSSALILTADGALVTRPNSHAILPGCTRAAVQVLAEQHGLRWEERLFTVEEALMAREAMLTSASNFVLPIISIDGHAIGDGRPGPVAERLRGVYIETARAQN
ncbi:D-amino-acid transaminase [uncultured Sphingomonas sp.]|uniref:D-amino-acid transaminase n=1 Tax=uncultured Sphingomonas sp. TaxID=158754 RepID=UPI0025CDD785|nr:D-amino-acid transaminase [uncultured Sphingomonas sp.]